MNWGVSNQTIQELEDKLFSEILIEQRKINSIKAADQEKIDSSNQFAKMLTQLRGTGFSLPSLFSGKGHGPFVELIDGSIKLDLIGGIGPYILGHSHPLQIRAFLSAAKGNVLNSTNFLPANLSVELSQKLIDAAGKSKLENCWFCGSGSMANDSAMRLLWTKRAPRNRILAFENSFAGRSLVMQSITQGDSNTKDLIIDYIPFPKDHESAKKCLSLSKSLLSKYGDSYITFYGELVQGEAGINLPQSNALKEVFSQIKDFEIPIWIDEVQTFARTTQLFAFQTFEVDEFVDLCTIGKAFNVSAVLYSSAYTLSQGLGGTFQGNIASLIFAIDLLNLFKTGQFFHPKGRASSLSDELSTLFNAITLSGNSLGFKCSAHGLGLMWAFKIHHKNSNIIELFMKELYNNGIIVWKAGREEICIRMLFPYTLDHHHQSSIKNIFINTLSQLNASEK